MESKNAILAVSAQAVDHATASVMLTFHSKQLRHIDMQQGANGRDTEAPPEGNRLQPDAWLGVGVLFALLGMLMLATAWFMGAV